MRRPASKRIALCLTLAATLSAFSLPGAALVQATAKTTHEFLPLFQFTFVPCAAGGTGEFVLITGTFHVLSHRTITGDRLNINQQTLLRGATGVGQTTGDVYRATGGLRFHDTFDMFPPDTGAAEFTFVNNFKLIGPGPGNNLLIHQTLHRTINANGEVATEVVNFSAECR